MKAVGERLKKGEKLTPEEDVQFNAWDEEYKQAEEAIRKVGLIEEREKLTAINKLEAEKVNPEEVKHFNVSAQEARTLYVKSDMNQRMSKLEQEKYDFLVAQDAAFRKMLSNQELTKAEQALVAKLKNNSFEERAQTVTTSGGGYTIPQGFVNDIVMYLKFVSPFFAEMQIGPTQTARSLFYFLNTATGNDLPIPTIDDTAVTGELLAINTDAFANTADMTFGQITMKAYKYNPKPMKVPNELLTDSGIDLPALIAEVLGTRLGRIVNTHLTTGDNSSKPQGIVTGASLYGATAGNDALTFADIIELEHSVDASYRRSPFARFMFHDGVLKYMKKLTIGSSTYDSRPLWQPSLIAGAPDTIDGYQYLINNDMASSVADQAKAVLFGDMKAYAVRQAGPLVMKFLGERFADIDQVAWMLLGRFDGRYRNTSAIKYLKIS